METVSYNAKPSYGAMTRMLLGNLNGVGSSNTNEVSCRPLHVVAFAYPLQGHIIPMFNFAKKLAAKGVIVTFVNTESCHANIIKSHNGEDPLISHARSSGLDIRSAQVGDGLPVEFDRSLNHDEFMESLRINMILHVEEFIADLSTKEPPVSCFIADTFFVWPDRISKKFGIPHASFWTEAAVVFSIYYHWDLLVKNGHHPFLDNEHESLINYIPGVSDLKVTDLPSYLQELDVSTVGHKIIYAAFQSAHGADWIVSNTVEGLESRMIAELQLRKPFLSVGPLLPSAFLNENSSKDETVGTSMWQESDCTIWLDSQPKRSVIYISFGSYAHVSIAQIEEIAMGLLESKQPFIWVLRPDIVASGTEDILPEEFVKETKGQGLVIQWSSQLKVLSHPSVGGFLTHCGWNSILESLWLGIPMLAFPLLTDQSLNRRLTVEEWGVAMGLGGSFRYFQNNRALVGREEIARTLKKFMDVEEGNKLRLKIESMKEVLKEAVMLDGGSSNKNLDLFVQALSAKNQST